MTSKSAADPEFSFASDSSTDKTTLRLQQSCDVHTNTNNAGAFDFRLSNDELMWFDYLKNTWNLWKKGKPSSDIIIAYFEQIPNPFQFSLKMIVICYEYKDCKPKTLPYHVMEQLKLWKSMRNGDVVDLLTDLKLTAFNVALHQKNTAFVKLTVDAFDILNENEIMVPIIEDMLLHHQYREAHRGIMVLSLQGVFGVDKLLVPLVLQDKLNSVDEYLSSCPSQVQPLVEFLDNLLDRTSTVKSILENFVLENGIPDVKWEKLHHKPLGKLLARLCTAYKLPISSCKNLYRYRTSGGLRFLVHQKFSQNAVSDSAWEDLVKDNLSRCPEIKQELVSLIDDYDPKESLKWAKYYEFPLDEYPSGAKYLLSSNPSDVKVSNVDNWNEEASTSKDHYKLSLPLANVIFINDHRTFYKFLESIKNCEFVGVDSEWKPSFGATRNNVALIQIATTENVFLLDTITLNKVEDESLWKTLWTQLFENVNIVKVGFGLENDLREIRSSLPGLSTIKVKGLGLLELGNLSRSLKDCGITLPYSAENGGESLSCLVENCFGVSLKKQEQCSNWENRPLRDAQLEYAALDSYVLIEIYLVFKRLCLQNFINFDQLCYSVMIEKKPLKAMKVKKNITKDKRHYSQPLITPEKCKFFVECKYERLIASLRKCGIDTLPLPTNNSWTEIINLSLNDNRFIIVGKAKMQNINLFLESHYMEIENVDMANCVDVIFKYFNINSSLVKRFGRCEICNGNDVRSVSHDIMRQHYHCRNIRNAQQNETVTIQLPYINSCNNKVTYHEFDADAFLSDEDDDDCPLTLTAVVTEDYNKTKQTNSLDNKTNLDSLSNIQLDFNGLSESILSTVKDFFVCHDCGKCFWDN